MQLKKTGENQILGRFWKKYFAISKLLEQQTTNKREKENGGSKHNHQQSYNPK